jgi:adenine-specific DNA-methyltransferase
MIPERGGPEEIAATDDLVVVKRFGEPMYPALVPVDRVTRAPGAPYHTLINADNFRALQLLLYCYEGQIDAIYIDPRYNSGARPNDKAATEMGRASSRVCRDSPQSEYRMG